MKAMKAPGLILIEGMTGAGKSTTARQIAERLQAEGQPARWYHELGDDNPIRSKAVDFMRRNHPHVEPLSDVGPDGFARDPSVYALDQWGRLTERARQGAEVTVLESRYLQNSVQPRFMNGAPVEKVVDGFRKLAAEIAPAEPLLVYLAPRDVRAHLEATLAARDAAWASWFLDSCSSWSWSKAHGLRGEAALFGFYEAWERIAAELFALHPGPKLWLDDPQEDRAAAFQAIEGVLGIDPGLAR